MGLSATSPTSGVELLRISPVIPVVVLRRAEHAVPVARALLGGGMSIVEITLRTDAGLAAIERIAAEVPEMTVGAGTVLHPDHAAAAHRRNADFLVTPGSPASVIDAATETGLPVLPGASTVTEIMTLMERGFTALKFFPAAASGGSSFLKAVHGPIPEASFCPTGGVDATNAAEYLALPNVPCVGGSWLTPTSAVEEGHWETVERLAAAAVALRPAAPTNRGPLSPPSSSSR